MKKLNLVLGLLIGLTILSCSSDDECNEILEPNGNEFTLNCKRYETPIGRLNINRSTEFETASCKLQFANNPTGNGTAFDYQEGDTNINFVDIWLIIPSEFTLIDEIPSGTYTLENNLNSEINEQYVAFDIADWNRVIFDGFVVTNENTTSSYFNSNRLYGSEYEDVIVNVQKNGNMYTIDYTMVYKGRTINGFYEGELDVVDRWL
jgi:hypothetical protein